MKEGRMVKQGRRDLSVTNEGGGRQVCTGDVHLRRYLPGTLVKIRPRHRLDQNVLGVQEGRKEG